MNTPAWKLFEVTTDGQPKTLVHSLVTPYTGKTRFFLLDIALHKEIGTKGFNVFGSFHDLLRYLPRFRVRAKQLAACKVHVDKLSSNSSHSAYLLADRLYIPKINWDMRVLGKDIL